MSFQAYLDNIEKKTGKTPAEPRSHLGTRAAHARRRTV